MPAPSTATEKRHSPVLESSVPRSKVPSEIAIAKPSRSARAGSGTRPSRSPRSDSSVPSQASILIPIRPLHHSDRARLRARTNREQKEGRGDRIAEEQEGKIKQWHQRRHKSLSAHRFIRRHALRMGAIVAPWFRNWARRLRGRDKSAAVDRGVCGCDNETNCAIVT